MKLRHALPLALLLSAACADATDQDEGLPPDAAFGYETDGKADSFAIREGSPEAQAVLGFTNQPLANDQAGGDFQTLVDSELHKRAAKNIAGYRAGADGVFGSNDDQVFATLRDLDGVKYVGRVALMQLHDLAIANGFGQQGARLCSDYYEKRGGAFYIQDYEDLLALDQSKCNTLDGHLYIQVKNEYLPTAARQMAHLDNITEAQGQINVDIDGSFDQVAFRNLENASDRITIRLSKPLSIGFPKLKAATNLYLKNGSSHDFGAMETVTNLQMFPQTRAVEGFGSLTTAGHIKLTISSGHNDATLAFPKLEQVSGVFSMMSAGKNVSGTLPELHSVGEMNLQNTGVQDLKFPVLSTITGNLKLNSIAEPFAPFDALESVGENFSVTAPSFSGDVEGLGSLVTVGGDVNVNVGSSQAYTALNTLESIGGNLNMRGRCSGQEMDMFNKLTTVQSLSLSATGCNLKGFAALEEVPATFTFTGATTTEAFPKLTVVGANLTFRANNETHDLPALELVDGNFRIDTPSAANVRGFNSLFAIEGNFEVVGRRLVAIDGLQTLEGIAGSATFPSQFPRNEVDKVIDRLAEFSGRILFR